MAHPGGFSEPFNREFEPIEFHNSEPRSREERLAAQSREKLEKTLLKARRGCFHKYSEPGDPIKPEAASPMYADDADRFRRDPAAEMHEQKLEALKRQQEALDRKRVEHVEREQQRWERMAAEASAEASRIEAVRASGLRGRQNKSREHFNIITLDYHHTPEGQSLQYKDEVARYRSMLRSQNLFNKNHSVPHNIINGEARHCPTQLPPAPFPPTRE